MTKHESIIKGLADVRSLLVAMEAASVGRTPLIENIETVNSAIALLKAQEPVEAVIGGNNYGGTWWYQCPICNYQMDRYDNYCRHCGRAVKWDD